MYMLMSVQVRQSNNTLRQSLIVCYMGIVCLLSAFFTVKHTYTFCGKIYIFYDFHVSSELLYKFKKPFGIRLLNTTAEKLSCDIGPYKENFIKTVE